MSFLVLDLECQNHPYLGAVASPFCKENYIVAAGWCIQDKPVQSVYFNTKEEADQSNWFQEAVKDCTVIVAHNATFELHWLLHRHYSVVMDFLKRGGRIFCTQYAEYLLSHQTETYPALDEVAPRYGGTHKIDEVKLLWEQGVLTSEIDQDLLMRYLAGNSGDIENTRKVFFGQYHKLMANEMLEMFWQRMDSLLFNAVCTFNGLYIDTEVAARNHREQLQRVQELKQEVQALLPKTLPEEFNFNFGSDYHMSAWLFGGPVMYKKKVQYDPPKFEKIDCYHYIENGEEKSIPVQQYSESAALAGSLNDKIIVYQRGKNAGLPKVFSDESSVPKMKWGEGCFVFKGLIDLESLPEHVQTQFLGKRAEFRGKRFLCDDVTPVYSTSKDALDLLANFTSMAKPLKELAQLEKDNGTYYIQHEYNANGELKKTKGMLQFVGEDSIIHHQLNGTSTITTRLSSSNPNLQNIPRDGTSKVKEMFASRFGASGKVVEVDYTALEVVTLAAASGDKALLQNLINGTDMHCLRLSGQLNEPYESVLEKCHNSDHPEHKKYKEMRTAVKAPSFAFQYGASAEGISFATGISVEDARKFIDTESKLFPESVAIRSVIREEVERTGSTAESLFREVTDTGVWGMYRRGYYQAPGGTCYSFRQYSQWKEGQQIMDYKDTQIANYWCQGEASFIVQTACGRVARWLINNDFFGGCVLCINTVHDAIYLDCINEEWARYAGKAVAQIMAETPKYMAEIMPKYLQWGYDTTPFPAVPEFGTNMYSKEHC